MAQFVNGISDAISGQRSRAFISDGIDDVVFDVVISDTESDSLKVTRHAIEDGSDVTDHVNSNPKKFNLDGIFTDSDLDVLNPGSFLNKTIEERLDVVKKWIEKKTILTYYGHDKDFEDVVIEDIGRKKAPATGEGISITLKIAKINIVSSLQTDIDIKTTTPKGKTAKQTEEKSGSVSSAATSNKSWAKTLFG